MVGSVANNVIVYKKYTYVPPTPPQKLIDSSVYVLDFTSRTFLHIGFDPTEQFNVVIHIITASRHVVLSPELLTQVFALMGNILSFILNPTQKTEKIVFLDTKHIILSSMVYRGENMLVVESKTQEGCRVLLKRSDLLTLQYLEWSIFETITRKKVVIRSTVLKQLDEMIEYFEKKINQDKQSTVEELITFIQSVHDMNIIDHLPKNEVSYISQLKLYAFEQIAERWLHKRNTEQSKDENKSFKAPSSPRYFNKFTSDQQAYDQIDGTCVYSPSTHSETFSSPLLSGISEDFDTAVSEMGWGTNLVSHMVCDENDGPLRFNKINQTEENLAGFYSNFKSI